MESSSALDRIENAAATWLARRENSGWSPADQANLDEWLAADPNHRVSYLRVLTAWRRTDRLKSVSAGLPKGEVPPPGAIRASPFFTLRDASGASMPVDSTLRREQKTSRIRVYAVAASIALAIALGIFAYTAGVFDRHGIYSTPVGGMATVPTPDGSIITLNTDTQVQVEITDRARTIRLKRGEAFFDVAKDATRTFTVYANDQRVVALGTKFSVRVAPQGVRVLVTEGSVRLERDGSDTTAKQSAGVVAGSVVEVQNGKISLLRQPVAQVEQALSWRSGYIALSTTPLPEAVAEFNRYNTRQFVIEDPALEDISVGGNFQVNNVDGFMRLLQKGFSVQAEAHGNRIELRRKKGLPVQEPG